MMIRLICESGRLAYGAHVVAPLPVWPWICVPVVAAAGARIVRIRHLVVADHVRPVDRDLVLVREMRDKPRGGAVHRLRERAA